MIKKAAKELFESDDILIICHIRPDGDTIGSAFALYYPLKAMGKRVAVACSSEITPKYHFVTEGNIGLKPDFEPKYIVAVDVGDIKLLGDSLEIYADRIDLDIDHHPTNKGFGKLNILNPKSAAAGELIYEILLAAGVEITPQIATCLYTSISTDTGCFRYSSTTSYTLRTVAELIDAGANLGELNKYLFEQKTRQQFELEKMAFDNLHFYRNGTTAIMVISTEMMIKSGATDDDSDGLSAIPRKIEGVDVAFTVRETPNSEYRISARSNGKVDVSKVCTMLGGGGHMRAAGCNLSGELSDVLQTLVDTTIISLEENDKA